MLGQRARSRTAVTTVRFDRIIHATLDPGHGFPVENHYFGQIVDNNIAHFVNLLIGFMNEKAKIGDSPIVPDRIKYASLCDQSNYRANPGEDGVNFVIT
jgi:hypothetical protein